MVKIFSKKQVEKHEWKKLSLEEQFCAMVVGDVLEVIQEYGIEPKKFFKEAEKIQGLTWVRINQYLERKNV